MPSISKPSRGLRTSRARRSCWPSCEGRRESRPLLSAHCLPPLPVPNATAPSIFIPYDSDGHGCQASGEIMTSRGIGPGVRPQPFDVTRPERSGKSPEPRAQGSVLRRLKTDVQIRIVKTAYGGDLRIRSARGKSVDGTGLNGLAGNKRSGSEGAKDVLRQLIECQHCDWKKQIGGMTKDQLLQTYKNVKHHSAVLSAIEQTHGNPSALYDLARKIADTVTQAVRDKGMRADDIVPKPFDRIAEKNEGLVEILGRELLRPLASGDRDAGVVLKQLLRYGSSDDLWMQSVSRMENEEIAQVLKNLRNNSVLFSAIAQTHGNPSALYDFVKGFAALFLAEA